MARPIGTIQKRNESKYWLPEGIKLKEDQECLNYRKDTKLIFIDPEFGEFISYFKALQDANASTHPKAIQKRREETNKLKYGGTNPSHSKEVRQKAQNTMIKKYGVEHALQNPEFIKKSKETTLKRYGVENGMHSEIIKVELENNNIQKFGVKNPMQNVEIQNKLKSSVIAKYGVDNFFKTDEFKQKYFEAMYANNTLMRSKGELEIEEYVKSLNIDCKTGFLGGKDPISLDIKINDLKIGIEYNGAYWHSEANKFMKPDYHLNKFKKASSADYRLIQIFDFEWNNKKNQVKSFLKSALGKNSRTIFARNTEIKEVNKNETNEFLKKYHILGQTRHFKAYGLYLDSELLNIITVSKHHRNNSEIVLSRYAGKEDISVSGGLSKLVSHVYKIHGPITTWIDLRFSNGNNWIKNGWKLASQLPPDYFYINTKNGQIISKQARSKKIVGTPEGMTEHEHALLDGLARIYDCGKLKLIYED